MTQPSLTGVPRPDFGIRIPERMHPAADRIGEHLLAWAAEFGLATDAAARARLDAAGFHLAAARTLPDARQADVEVFAQWVLWLFHLDDEQDEGPMGRSPEIVHATYTAITSIIEGQPAPAAAPPAVTALADLWPRTARRMSAQWRRRILQHIHHHRDAFLAQIAHRQNGTLASPEEYPALRRDDNAMFMYDLVEVAYQAEIPPDLAATNSWTELCAASSDIIAWTNDVVSLPREAALGETTNYVIVLQHATGCDERTALEQVHLHITRRLRELDEAARAFIADAQNLAPTADPARLDLVVRTVRDMPGAHLAWMFTSGRHGGQAVE
ncbi:terpene synthase family protein [Frankia sp. QA3]|uniref:terpene synthase family protein n=1 Tax=Frankia sp. QA3 TaxID=710111 RepID=UPI0012F8C7C6|nr:terpene synthase family protein [Frankia sp. QA3]